MSELTISKCREILEECDEVLEKAEPDSQQARSAHMCCSLCPRLYSLCSRGFFCVLLIV